LLEVPKAGGVAKTVDSFDVASMGGCRAVAVDSGAVYWMAQNMIRKVPLDSSAPSILKDKPADTVTAPFLSMRTNSASLFFSDNNTYDLYRIPKAGGSPENLAHSGRGGFWVDDEFLFYNVDISNYMAPEPSVELYKMSSTASDASLLLQNPSAGLSGIMQSDNEKLYFTLTDGSVLRIGR